MQVLLWSLVLPCHRVVGLLACAAVVLIGAPPALALVCLETSASLACQLWKIFEVSTS